MQYLQQAKSFWSSKDFWYYHGYGLTLAWLGISFVSILLKKLVRGKFGLYLHALLFFICDSATLFLAGGAFYRVYPNLNKFADWSLLKQAHIGAGIVFTLFMLLQHLGGVGLLLTKKNGAPHRKFGMFVSIVMRFIAVFGWLLIKEDQMTGMCAGAAVIETILLLSIGENKGTAAPAKPLFPVKPKRT